MDGAKQTVTEIVLKIRDLLEGNLGQVTVEGEISGLTSSAAGHWYFTLSDKNSSISCALFRGDAMRNPIIRKLKDGDLVLGLGGIGVYTKRGTFQLIVKRLLPAGKGKIQEEFEKLKRKLATEGLFDSQYKKPIPQYPKRVVVITAARGAAVQDFINICKRRSIWLDLLIVDSLVQGDGAARSITDSLRTAIKNVKDADVIVLTRGGGSPEDLQAFNDEELAREIFACPVPVISAVGHQVDFSISDFVADLRCETPSAAAEVLTDGQNRLKERFEISRKGLLMSGMQLANRFQKILIENNPSKWREIIWRRFLDSQKRLERLNIKDRLFELVRVHEKHIALDDVLGRLKMAMQERVRAKRVQADELNLLLNSMNPQSVLERGYSITYDEDGKVVATLKEYNNLEEGKGIKIAFADGKGVATKGKAVDAE